jgi:choloylglycine hydrolase
MKEIITRLSILAAALMLSPAILACTDFQITATDGSQVIARSMEFALPLSSDIVSVPRGTLFTNLGPDGKPAMSWKTKYGFLMVNGLKQPFTVDGMNEMGVAFEYLYLPGETTYMTVPAGKNAQALTYFNLGSWILGNFTTIDEIKQALSTVYVYQQALPNLGNTVFELHAMVHDASGKGIVIEFVKGQMNVYDYLGVATNSPQYPWHITHLPQFLNLSPYNPKPLIINGMAYNSNGEGTGSLGLPGDISPASRFVKMAFMRQYAMPVMDAASAVNLAEHIINNVDIPAGISRSKGTTQDSIEVTQWTVFKDLTHKIFYYHSYQDMTLRAIDLSKIDFSENAAPVSMPITGAAPVVDMTQQFKVAVVKPAQPAAQAPTMPMPAATGQLVQ